MKSVELKHFLRAAVDIGANGDNDTLPFDVDTRFVKKYSEELAKLSYEFFEELQRNEPRNSARRISELGIFCEHLLTPNGAAGFRITTKIHPFWAIYFNGLGIGIADALEPRRSPRVYSYRLREEDETSLFDRSSSWRAYREKTVLEAKRNPEAVVVQTDISSFYEHVSHHYLQNSLNDLFPDERVGNQVNSLLGKFSAGRSFGLPVGGQASRILAELFLDAVDQKLNLLNIEWYRYVDDYVLIAGSNAEAYEALSILSYALADYGLTLNKSKTTMLSAKHFADYVTAQLGGEGDQSERLRAIDLRFDPYSDNPVEEYEALREIVSGLDIHEILNHELAKSLPDNFMVSQISRTLRLQLPDQAMSVIETLLAPANLHAFRASWATIMRGVAVIRNEDGFAGLHPKIDELLDGIADHSIHLLQAETSVLHYLKTLHAARTDKRAKYVQRVFDRSSSQTVKRACIECWRWWKDRAAFTALRNGWPSMNVESQRLLWLSSFSFGDQGDGARRQVDLHFKRALGLGIERQGKNSFGSYYLSWCDSEHTLP